MAARPHTEPAVTKAAHWSSPAPTTRPTPGKLADLVAYPTDPLTADLDDLAQLTPLFTIVGGRTVHDPDGMLPPA